MARFERSTLPDDKGTRNVVPRFLKIMTPVKCVIAPLRWFIVAPKEGELYRRTTQLYHWKSSNVIGEFNPPVWIANIDKRVSMRGLQLLWDT